MAAGLFDTWFVALATAAFVGISFASLQLSCAIHGEYSGEMETNLRNGIQDLFTIIANDIKDSEDPKVYENKNSRLKGYPDNHKALLISEENNRRVMRFTQGWRNGAICSMPYDPVKNSTVCL